MVVFFDYFVFDVDDVGVKDFEMGEEKVIDVLVSSGLSDEEIVDMMEDSVEYLVYCWV